MIPPQKERHVGGSWFLPRWFLTLFLIVLSSVLLFSITRYF